MSVKKKTGIILLTAAAMVISGGCGKALVFDNEPQDRLAYYGRSDRNNKKENRNLTEGKFILR